jgi:rubrerythrin
MKDGNMDIVDFAMKMELDGKAFYEKHAASTKDPDLKQILVTLAEEEERHYRFFKSLKEEPQAFLSADAFSAPGTIARIQNIFQELAQQPKATAFGSDTVSIWTEALRIEEQAVKFYTEKAKAEPDAGRKALLLRIAEEETSHVYMIDGVLMYLKHPQAFADSVQYRDFQSLEGRRPE